MRSTWKAFAGVAIGATTASVAGLTRFTASISRAPRRRGAQMPRRRRLAGRSIALAMTALAGLAPGTASAQGRPIALAVTRTSGDDIRAWDQQVDQLIRSRNLRVRESQPDPLAPNRQHQRLDQYYQGVRIAGGDLTRQLASDGTVSLFGVIHDGIDVNVTPRLSADEARSAIAAAAGGQPFGIDAELVVLPLSDGYHLAYFGRAATGLEIINVFVDANSGAPLRQYSDFISEVGAGTGTYGDRKKVSTTAFAGGFVADDKLRPSEITTFDMKGSFARAQAVIAGLATSMADIASSASNDWTDGNVVDAHVDAGLYYDYLFKRFGRHGLNDRDLRIDLLTHAVRLADIFTAPISVVSSYYINAFYSPAAGPNGQGLIVLGEGAPRGFLGPNVEVKPFSAALDVVAHELTHGVTASSAGLNGFPLSEAGALNEGFSDIFGTAITFFYQTAGSTPLHASYQQGRDLTVPSGLLSRSLSNPAETGDPDHYSRRVIGGDPHFNSTILGHAFYLAIEGGTNRTSGLSVQGVGASRREQVERVFFQALTRLLPSNATFAITRAATIQAARDLYGSGGTVEQAITQAWDAVGVQARTAPAAAVLPIATTPQDCPTVAQPSWDLFITVSAGAANLLINQWQMDFFDAGGARVNTMIGAPFASSFNACGPGSPRVLAQSDACSAVCTSPGGGRTSGSVQVSFTGTDEASRPVSFSTPRVTLSR